MRKQSINNVPLTQKLSYNLYEAHKYSCLCTKLE